jgi:hypothetical protein
MPTVLAMIALRINPIGFFGKATNLIKRLGFPIGISAVMNVIRLKFDY